MSVLLLIGGLILFVGLVVVHEWGHFIMARRAGVEVEEFAIGFPPRAKIIGRKKGTLYTLNWLPLGGFVKLKGEHDADKTPGSFGAAKLSDKIKIMVAGVTMNLVVAFLLLTLLALIGMPKLIENQYTVKSDTKVVSSHVYIGEVELDSPAAKAGLRARDRIDTIGQSAIVYCPTGAEANVVECITKPTNIVSVAELQQATKDNNGLNANIYFTRNNKSMVVKTDLRTKAEVDKYNTDHHCDDQNYTGTRSCQGLLGIVPTEYSINRSTWSAPIVAVGLMKQLTELTFKGLGSALKGLGSIISGIATNNHEARRHGQQASSAQVSGPIGIFIILKDGSILGYQFVLMVIAVISLTLAIMNVLPIPALDGGRLFVTLLFRLIRKPLKARTEDLIHGAGFALLLVLLVLVTIVDLRR